MSHEVYRKNHEFAHHLIHKMSLILLAHVLPSSLSLLLFAHKRSLVSHESVMTNQFCAFRQLLISQSHDAVDHVDLNVHQPLLA